MLYRIRQLRRSALPLGLFLALGCLAPPLTGTTSAAASTTATSDVVAKRGDRSQLVAKVQQLLIEAGIAVRGGADGIFGAGTEAAVKQYQGQRGLPANGRVDTPTAITLGIVAPTPLLSKGSSGTEVEQVQRQLMALGISVRGGADGRFGPGTAKAVGEFQTSHNLTASGEVDAATAAILTGAAGQQPTTSPPAQIQLAAFPVPTTCKFWDTWGAPRSGGRKHEGVDIAAAKGTEIYAVQDGKITKRQADSPGSRPGNAIWLTASDGTYYFYGHLNSFATGVGVGSPVTAGDVIGYVGSTGNALIPHLHLEIHPGGGGPVNPYPIVKAASSC